MGKRKDLDVVSVLVPRKEMPFLLKLAGEVSRKLSPYIWLECIKPKIDAKFPDRNNQNDG